MTEEQKNCEYCHGVVNGYGMNFADHDEPCKFCVENYEDYYRINVWGIIREESFDVVSDYINYCPMCGRRLGKED